MTISLEISWPPVWIRLAAYLDKIATVPQPSEAGRPPAGLATGMVERTSPSDRLDLLLPRHDL